MLSPGTHARVSLDAPRAPTSHPLAEGKHKTQKEEAKGGLDIPSSFFSLYFFSEAEPRTGKAALSGSGCSLGSAAQPCGLEKGRQGLSTHRARDREAGLSAHWLASGLSHSLSHSVATPSPAGWWLEAS